MPKKLPTDLPIYSFPSAKELEAHLDQEHTTSPGFHLKLARKSSGIPSVTAAEAVELALCFGWINGQGNSFDDDWYLMRYTQRRPNSSWSKINVNAVEKLLQEGGRMRPAGIAAVEAAKADGRWDRAYPGPKTIEMTDDFAAALAEEPAAKDFFKSLNKTDRYLVLLRVHTATSPKNRTSRIENLVKMLAKGETPPRPTKPKTRGATNSRVNKKTQVAATQRSPARKQKTQKERAKTHDRNIIKARRAGLRSRS